MKRLIIPQDLGMTRNTKSTQMTARLIMRILGLNRLNNIVAKIPENSKNEIFAREMLEKLNIPVSILEKSLNNIPLTGGALITSNCPHGLLDILILTSVIKTRRPDAKFLISSKLASVNPFAECALAPDEPDAAIVVRRAVKFVASGGVLIAFPADEPSTYSRSFRNITDTEWHHKSLRIAKLAAVPIIPIYIEGHNSFKYLILSKLNPSLATLRHPLELLNKSQMHIEMAIGETISYDEAGRTPAEVSHFVRTSCYLLGERIKAHQETVTKDTQSCVYQPLTIDCQESAFNPNSTPELLEVLEKHGKILLETSIFRAITLDSKTIAEKKIYTPEQLSNYTGKQRSELFFIETRSQKIVMTASAITARDEVSELAHKRFASHQYFEFSTRKIANLMQNCVEISCSSPQKAITADIEAFLHQALTTFAEKRSLRYIVTNLTARAAEGSVGFAILARYLRARKWSDPLSRLIVPRSERLKIRSSAAIDAVRGVKKPDLIFSLLRNIENTSPLTNPTAHTLLTHSARVAALATELTENISTLNALVILDLTPQKNVSRGTIRQK